MRSKYVDNLKGIGIFLVVLGHCIQYGNGVYYMDNNLFFYNKLFEVGTYFIFLYPNILLKRYLKIKLTDF